MTVLEWVEGFHHLFQSAATVQISEADGGLHPSYGQSECFIMRRFDFIEHYSIIKGYYSDLCNIRSMKSNLQIPFSRSLPS